MKVIKLKNSDLVAAALFLRSLALGGKPTRGKQKFLERLMEKNNEFFDQEKEVVKKYCQTNEKDEPLIKDNNYVLKEGLSDEDKEKMKAERSELMNETAEISFVEYSEKYEALFKALVEWPEKIEPEHSYIYDVLMDEYENNEEEK